MTMHKYVVYIPMGHRFEPEGDNRSYREAQREFEVWMQAAPNQGGGGFRWDAAGTAMIAPQLHLRSLNPERVAARDGIAAEREQLRLFVVPNTSSVCLEITAATALRDAQCFTPLARFLAERGETNIAGILHDRGRGNGVNREGALQLAPQYLGPAAFVVLGTDAGNGDRMVAAFETAEQAEEYREDCWQAAQSPTTPPIAVPPLFRHDREALVQFLEAVVRADMELQGAPERAASASLQGLSP